MIESIVCTDCGCVIEHAEMTECPNCGSLNRKINAYENTSINITELARGKVKEEGQKKPAREFTIGDDFSVSKGKYVHKERDIDRTNDKYTEIVTDKETCEIIHECREKLSEHQGHGSAKEKKQFTR